MPNLDDLMKMAQEAQTKLMEAHNGRDKIEVEGVSGGGLVKIKASAKGKTTLTVDDLKPTTPGVDLFYRVDAVRDGKTTSSRTSRFSLLPGKVGTLKVDKVAADGVGITWPAVANSTRPCRWPMPPTSARR